MATTMAKSMARPTSPDKENIVADQRVASTNLFDSNKNDEKVSEATEDSATESDQESEKTSEDAEKKRPRQASN